MKRVYLDIEDKIREVDYNQINNAYSKPYWMGESPSEVRTRDLEKPERLFKGSQSAWVDRLRNKHFKLRKEDGRLTYMRPVLQVRGEWIYKGRWRFEFNPYEFNTDRRMK